MRKKILKTLKSPPERPETERIAELFPNFKISNNISEITTPYVFFIKDPFDFQPEEANFHRMILQAEQQRFVKNEYLEQKKKLVLNFKVPILSLVLG